MAAYKPTMSYRLIYIFTIHDAQHEGYWKIGKTNFDSVNSYKQLPPNCAELNCAARDRIDQYTKTAMVEYDLQYTELARRTVTFPDGTTDTELFDDDDVHSGETVMVSPTGQVQLPGESDDPTRPGISVPQGKLA